MYPSFLLFPLSQPRVYLLARNVLSHSVDFFHPVPLRPVMKSTLVRGRTRPSCHALPTPAVTNGDTLELLDGPTHEHTR